MAESLPWNLSLHGLLGLLDATPGGLSDKEAERRLAKSVRMTRSRNGAARCGGKFSIALPIL